MTQTCRLFRTIALGALTATTLSSQMAFAQDSSAPLSGEEYLAYLHELSNPVETPQQSIGLATTVGIASGFTLPKNSGFMAIALSDTRERQGSGSPDGSLAFGLGFGDAVNGLGFEAIIGLSSIGASGAGNGFDAQDFGDSGSLNLKVSRQITSPFDGESSGIALGVGRALTWGDMEDQDPNYYAAWSSTFSVPTSGRTMPGLLSVGYGSAIGTNEDEEGAFVGLGLGVADWLSVGGSWYGNEVIAGVITQARLRPDLNLQIGLSYGDVMHENSDGRWSLSVVLVDFDLF